MAFASATSILGPTTRTLAIVLLESAVRATTSDSSSFQTTIRFAYEYVSVVLFLIIQHSSIDIYAFTDTYFVEETPILSSDLQVNCAWRATTMALNDTSKVPELTARP